jgi:hypothetical protein
VEAGWNKVAGNVPLIGGDEETGDVVVTGWTGADHGELKMENGMW